MRYASPALIAYLAANSTFLMADLYQISLQTGQVFRWTDADINLTYAGNLYTAAVDNAGEPVLERGEIRNTRGLEVSTMDLTQFCGQSAQVLGVNCTLAAHNGAFDNAQVLVTRVVMPTWGDTTTLGGYILFDGLVADVDLGSTEVVLHVSSSTVLLAVQMPRTLFLPACANTFGDASCGISIPALTIIGTTASGSTATAIKGAPAQPANYYQNGVLSFTSGVCSGTSVAVSAYDGTTITPATSLPATPAPGDTFTVYPGCARSMAACQKFWGTASPVLVVGAVYQITSLGTTTWTAAGAPAGAAVGTIFTATATAAGTGTAWNLGYFRGCPFVPPAESGL
jgi:uncharacterized phage protein (TIGR02218 family)